MTTIGPFISQRILYSNRRVTRRVGALSYPQIARQFNDVRSFMDGTDLCSRGLGQGRRQGEIAL
jgi:hypothetical protein